MLRVFAVGAALALWGSSSALAAAVPTPKEVVSNYISVVYASYNDAYDGAVELQKSIQTLLDTPTEASLKAARETWIRVRIPYLQTEGYRFYQGPIDFEDKAAGAAGPETRINAWPLNEAYIDYVKGNDKAGIINDGKTPITLASLTAKNQQKDEADVATGYHAIEFLLWGQDLNDNGPGVRPASDYAKGKPANERRREYLKQVSRLLVNDLALMKAAWEPGKKNYASAFVNLPGMQAEGKMLSGIATMASVEMASERMGNALISGDQEDEQSCFSDTTQQDFTYNLKSVSNVYLGEYGNVLGASLSDLVAAKDKKLDEQIRAQLKKAQSDIDAIPYPFDQVLKSPKDSAQRKTVTSTVDSLRALGVLLQQAGKLIGAEVVIVSE